MGELLYFPTRYCIFWVHSQVMAATTGLSEQEIEEDWGKGRKGKRAGGKGSGAAQPAGGKGSCASQQGLGRSLAIAPLTSATHASFGGAL